MYVEHVVLLILAALLYLLIGFSVYIALVSVWQKAWTKNTLIRCAAAIFFPFDFYRNDRRGSGAPRPKILNTSIPSIGMLVVTILFWPLRLLGGLILASYGFIAPRPPGVNTVQLVHEIKGAIRLCERALKRASTTDERVRLKRSIEMLKSILDPSKRLHLIKMEGHTSNKTKE